MVDTCKIGASEHAIYAAIQHEIHKAGAVSLGWVGAPNCGRNEILVPGADGARPYCRATYGGFGVTSQRIHGHSHGHGGHGHYGGGG